MYLLSFKLLFIVLNYENFFFNIFLIYILISFKIIKNMSELQDVFISLKELN